MQLTERARGWDPATFLLCAYAVAIVALPTDVGIDTGFMVVTPARILLALGILVLLRVAMRVRRPTEALPGRWLTFSWVAVLALATATTASAFDRPGLARLGSMALEGAGVFWLGWWVTRRSPILIQTVLVGVTAAVAAIAGTLALIGQQYQAVLFGTGDLGGIPLRIGSPGSIIRCSPVLCGVAGRGWRAGTGPGDDDAWPRALVGMARVDAHRPGRRNDGQPIRVHRRPGGSRDHAAGRSPAPSWSDRSRRHRRPGRDVLHRTRWLAGRHGAGTTADSPRRSRRRPASRPLPGQRRARRPHRRPSRLRCRKQNCCAARPPPEWRPSEPRWPRYGNARHSVGASSLRNESSPPSSGVQTSLTTRTWSS